MPDVRPYAPTDRLESWKEIAAYLRRDISTVQRWEKREGLPVHRHVHDKLGSVYAHRSELDQWRANRNSDDGETRETGSHRRIAVGLLTILAIAAAAFGAARWMQRGQPRDESVLRFLVMPPPGTAMDVGAGQVGFAVSPNGRYVVFLAKENGGPALAVRALDSLHATVLRGTEGGYAPFWSPDSRVIGFYTDGRLKKIALAGGAPETICDAETSTNSHGATWSRDNLIVFASANRHLLRVPAAGGVPTPATALDGARGDDAHHYPAFLPDGRHVLYVATSAGAAGRRESTLRLATLDTTTSVDLIAGALRAEYVSPGFLLFGRSGVLLAQRFDAKLLKLGEETRTVARGIRVQPSQGLAAFSASTTGVLAYAEPAPFNQLVWVGRDGRDAGEVAPPGVYVTPRLSRSGNLLAVEQHTETNEGQTGDLWVIDMVRGVSSRLIASTPSSHAGRPVWSPDNTRVAVGRSTRLMIRHVGSDAEQALLTGSEPRPSDWSRDGRFLIYDDLGPNGEPDIFALPLEGSRHPLPLQSTRSVERRGRLSPDGRWLAFESDETGRAEIYVRPFPDGRGHWQVSSGGGVAVRWRGDGRELYYIAPGGRLKAVPLSGGDRFVPGTPVPYFDVQLEPERGEFWYEVSNDGQRVLVSRVLRNVSPLVLVSNWLPVSERRPTVAH